MPLATSHLVDDYQFKFALKNMLPIPSNSEQQILLDEYSAQLSQFSIAINRIIKEEASDENCVNLLKLLAGMYTLLKTTLLSPPLYRDLFGGVCRIEADAHRFISNWAMKVSDERQVELFELGWWCESALPRAYLVTLLFSSLPALWTNPEYIAEAFAACKALQHPLKGSFLFARFHSFILRLFFTINDDGECLKSAYSVYSVETFVTLLKYFCRWHQSLPVKGTDPSYIASLFHETFEGFFAQISRMTSSKLFESVVLPTFLVEIVNCGDSLAQSLTFQTIINEFDAHYLLAQLGNLIKSTGQFASGIDLKTLLDGLFRKVQSVENYSGELFFNTIWDETSKLIKNRSEIDQCDTVIISSLVINLISHSKMESNSLTVKSIEKVLEFLVKTLKNIRPEGFNAEEGFGVGKQIFELVRAVVDEFDFDKIILKLEGLPDLLNCLLPKFSRNCCLTIILPKLTVSNSGKGNICSDGEPENAPQMIASSPFSLIVKLFGCITQRDLVQLIDGKEEEISSVTNDLEEFSESILVDFPIEKIEEFYNSANSPSSCLNLFLIPKLLELSSDPLLCKKMISGFLCNTSTVISSVPASESTSPPFQWIRPEYPKLMAVKMYLQVIDRIELDYYEFYTEILTILNNNISQDQLKIEIIESVLSSLTRSRNKDKSFSIVDFRCLLDHLAMESGQLLRKSDRCKLLLKIFDNCGNGEIFRSTSTYSEKDCNERSTINPGYSFKYLDQVTGLLNQLSTNENELKFELTCKLFEFIFETKGKLETFDEKKLYNWAIELIKNEPKKEIKFYAIKIKRDEQIAVAADEDEDEDEIVEGDESTKIVTDKIVVDNVIEVLTSDDLQKLKIFESFQM